MRDRFEKQIKKIQSDWKSLSDEWDDVSYEYEMEQESKKNKRLKDETKDINKGRKLNKRTYR